MIDYETFSSLVFIACGVGALLLVWRLGRFLWIVFKPATAAERKEFERKYGIEEIKRKHDVDEA